MLVRYTDGFDKNNEELFLTNFSSNMGIKWRNNTMVEITTSSGKEKDELKTYLEARKDVSTCQQSYKLENGLDIVLFDEIVVQFLPGVGKEQQEELNQKFKTKVIATYEIFQILKVPKGNDALDIANRYFESGLVKFSKPNFLSNFEPFQVMPNDTYFNRQITFHNTGQVFTDGHSGTNDADIDAPEAWTLTTGSNNIIVAVIDEGVTSDHPDLPNTRQLRLTGSDFVDGDANPSPTGNDNHGNACAGVIAATMNNNQGIAGIAPDCRIMPIRISYNSSTVADFALAIRFAANNGAHVISNSWGLADPFSSPPYSPNLYPEVVTAIQYAVSSGRNGNGCVVAFAAGNTANHAASNNGYISFPANVTISGVITVGASDRNDNQANYSPTSNPNHSYNQIIDIVAPSHRAYPNQVVGETFEMWSIDIPDIAGYNLWPGIVIPPTTGEILPNTGTNNLAYTARFGGTSHACPVVAGAAALMLSINPNLTQQQIFNILTSNADKVGGYTYTNGRSNELGFGRLNACRAVAQVIPTIATISGPSLVCASGSTYTVNNFPSVFSVVWSCSSNLVKISSSGDTAVFEPNGSGTGQIWATLTSTICGNVTFPAINVTASPGPISIDFDAPPGRFTAMIETVPDAASYKWYCDGVLNSSTTTTARFMRQPDNCEHVYYVDVIAVVNTTCESGISHAEASEPPCYYYSIFPNPASNEITITQNTSTTTSTESIKKPIKEVRIIDKFGRQALTQSFGDEVYEIKLNISNLQTGSYTIQINQGTDMEAYSIIKE